MIRVRSAVGVLVLVLALAGCSTGTGSGTVLGPPVKGSGVAKSETRPVSGVTAVSVNGIGRVVIQQTGKDALTVKADDNILPLLTSEERGSTLMLGIAPGSTIQTVTPIEFIVEVKELRALSLAGSTQAEVTKLEGEHLGVTVGGASSATISGQAGAVEVIVEGSSNLTLTGRSDELTANVMGSSHLKAEGLAAKKVKVVCEGASHAVVNASEQLDATASGASSVEYTGSPNVKQSTSGVGKVTKRG
jgi:hypothetical protein